MRGLPCQREVSGHLYMRLGTYRFCCRCGAYTQRQVRLLSETCHGREGSDRSAAIKERVRRLERMLAGKDPKTGAWIGHAKARWTGRSPSSCPTDLKNP